jgi:DNA segregation ATPase FtsK/SpoIIIE, S-DNA-T family
LARTSKKTPKHVLVAEATARFIRRRLVEAWGAAVAAVGTALALALLTYHPADPSLNTSSGAPPQNLIGLPGAYAADMLLQVLGVGAAVFALALVCWGVKIALHRGLPRLPFNLLSLLAASILLAMTAAVLPHGESWPVAAGFGGWLGQLADDKVAALAALVKLRPAPWVLGPVLAALTVPTLYLALGLDIGEWRATAGTTGRIIAGGWRRLAKLGSLGSRPSEPRVPRTPRPARSQVSGAPSIAAEEVATPVKTRVSGAPVKLKTGRRAEREREPFLDLEPSTGFSLPPLSLLTKPSKDDRIERASADALEQNARLLESVLDEFGVKGEIVQVRPGPVVTLYELEPAPGTKAARVIGLADDIARSMSAVSARIAVIPGKTVIGIELPNARRETVFLRELLSTPEYERSSSRLALTLGKEISGAPVIADLAAMPHLLIAGTTGSGKSVAINTMILSLLYRLTPEQCRFIMIDPKMLELSVYDDIPHLLSPVVTEPKKAVVALKWTVRQMEDRYQSMSKLGVRNLAAYNARIVEAASRGETLKRTLQTGFDTETGQPIYEDQELDLTPLPLIVVVVDEMADLMMIAGKEVESAIQRLSQMARAAGIHLIMATQRPSVDVITGTIKANFPTRISFQVTSKIDSRTILGEQGAEQLLGQGDMLYMATGGRLTRVHGPFVSDGEVERVVAYLKRQATPDYIYEVTVDTEDEDDFMAGFGSSSGDELYDRAVALVAAERKASTSFIQRHLQIGYNRAARIIEQMERQGVVSPANHVGKREVLVLDHGA